MKIKSMMVAALAALTLASCSKDGEVNPMNGEGEKATLSINIATFGTAAPEVKAVGSPISGDNVITNYTVFITNSNGDIQWEKYSSTSAPISGMDVTTDAHHVYIIANGGDMTGQYTTKDQLEAGEQAWSSSLWPTDSNKSHIASGSTTSQLTFITNADGSKHAQATVNLKFVMARITVKIVDNMYGDYDATKTDGSLVLENIAVLNVPAKTKIMGSSLAVTGNDKNYFSGISNSGAFAYWPTYNQQTADLLDDLDDDLDDTYYYYVFENDATTAAELPTLVTLIGTFGAGTKNYTVYYPVYLAPFENWSSGSVQSVERGKSYNITITLNVDPTIGNDNGGNGDGDGDDGNGGGTVDPTTPDETTNISIDVQLADWDPVTLNKEF